MATLNNLALARRRDIFCIFCRFHRGKDHCVRPYLQLPGVEQVLRMTRDRCRYDDFRYIAVERRFLSPRHRFLPVRWLWQYHQRLFLRCGELFAGALAD